MSSPPGSLLPHWCSGVMPLRPTALAKWLVPHVINTGYDEVELEACWGAPCNGRGNIPVQLILKKWGDDIAGAAKELEEKVGFPESVANRIATGELPMDAESVAKRAQDQGYDLMSLYHGTNDDFSEFDPERVGSAYGVDDQGFNTSSEDEAMKCGRKCTKCKLTEFMETLLSTDNPWLIDAPDGRSPVEYFESGDGVFNRGQNAAVDYGIDSMTAWLSRVAMRIWR